MNYRSLNFQLSEEDIKYLYDTYKTEEFRRSSTSRRNYYTGYHRHPNSNSRDSSYSTFHDEKLYKLYAPFVSKSLKEEGLVVDKMILSFSHMWAQIYTKDWAVGNGIHNHYSDQRTVMSWIHFVDVPDDQDCLYFKIAGEKIYPKDQRSGTMIFFPAWALHGVDPVETQSDRVVVAGNVNRVL